jgi:hypothetical protein
MMLRILGAPVRQQNTSSINTVEKFSNTRHQAERDALATMRRFNAILSAKAVASLPMYRVLPDDLCRHPDLRWWL